MAEGQDDSPSNKWTITVKTPKEKKTVEIEENATVKEVSGDVFIQLEPSFGWCYQLRLLWQNALPPCFDPILSAFIQWFQVYFCVEQS